MLEWRPNAIESTPIEGSGADSSVGESLSLLTWNLGYAGLDSGADFFMDGGVQVRPTSRARVEGNLQTIAAWLEAHPADLVLLQEVDAPSTRTFGIDQVQVLTQALPGLCWARALNFKVAFIPYPLLSPIGKIESGLVTLSRHRLSLAQRLQLPGAFPWPVRTFHLKRCIHELHLAAPSGEDWVILHLHLSTFDRQGQLRDQEMAFLRRRMQRLYHEGHPVIAAGDWNHAPPHFGVGHFTPGAPVPEWYREVPLDWTPPGWTWAFDPTTPSLRATDRPYRPGESFQTTVDAFLLSPDLELRAVRAYGLNFGPSDHHPVSVEVALRC